MTRGTSIAEAMEALNKKRALANAANWASAQRERTADLRGRIAHVTEYRDGLIAKRDRKAAQIPLRPNEERMWASKIDLANASIATLEAELSATTQKGPA